jgi:hypothetical protein
LAYFVKRFISKKRAKYLAQKFFEVAATHEYMPCPQVPNSRFNGYNLPFFLEELCDNRKQVSKVAGRQVLPTYTFARIYQTGNTLDKHTDRAECELSVTVNLSCDEPWPIYIDGEKFILDPGDGVVYEGSKYEHWRDPYQGQYCAQLFLHYVYEDGQHAMEYFDNNNLEIKKFITPKPK